jgi:hypothetical protein
LCRCAAKAADTKYAIRIIAFLPKHLPAMYLRPIAFALFAGSFSLAVAPAWAQASFSVGPRVGLNVSTYHFSEPSPVFRRGDRPGLEAGLTGSISFGHLALQPALLYSQKGFAQFSTVDVRTGTNLPIGSGELEYRTRLHYVTLPVNIAYTQHANGQGFQLFAGPYLGLLVSGRYESSIMVGGNPITDGGKITPVTNDAPDFGTYAHRFDAGLQGGVGYRFKALLLQANYSLGLRDVAARYSNYASAASGPAYYNRAFQVALTYLAGPAK